MRCLPVAITPARCCRRESNPHTFWAIVFKTIRSTSSTTAACFEGDRSCQEFALPHLCSAPCRSACQGLGPDTPSTEPHPVLSRPVRRARSAGGNRTRDLVPTKNLRCRLRHCGTLVGMMGLTRPGVRSGPGNTRSPLRQRGALATALHVRIAGLISLETTLLNCLFPSRMGLRSGL